MDDDSTKKSDAKPKDSGVKLMKEVVVTPRTKKKPKDEPITITAGRPKNKRPLVTPPTIPNEPVDNVRNANLGKIEEDMDKFVSDADIAADWAERVSKGAGYDRAANIFGMVGKPLTVLNAAFDIKNGKIVDGVIDLGGLFERINPYVFTYTTGKQVLMSNFNISGAYNDDYIERMDLLMQASAATRAGHTGDAMDLENRAKEIGKQMANLLADLKDK